MTAGAQIAAEVAAALAEAGEATGDGPMACALRKTAATPDATPWDAGGASYTYGDFTAVETMREVRDGAGMVIETRRTLMADATGPVPEKADEVAVGVASADADGNTVWTEIIEVRPLAPAGVALMYELDLAR